MTEETNPPTDRFRFYASERCQGKIVTLEEAEKVLLEDLAKAAEPEEILWKLVRFYKTSGRQMKTLEYLQNLSCLTDDPEKKATCYRIMGQCMEDLRDYEKAVTFYSQAFSLEPTNTDTWYFINNNLGYSLNQLGKYEDGAKYCRAAIKIDPTRCNAFKNLGLSFSGKGDYAEAATNFITATKVNLSDTRALQHLEELIEQHPELSVQIPNLLSQLEECRMAVELARQANDSISSG
jgi:tetratricopeptide (TPR) repeat protein